MSEEVVQALHTWLNFFSQEGPSNTVVENIALLMLQFLSWSVRLSDVNKLTIEAATYLIEGLTKWSVEYFRNTFNMMIQQERVKQISSVLSMGWY